MIRIASMTSDEEVDETKLPDLEAAEASEIRAIDARGIEPGTRSRPERTGPENPNAKLR
ncbi:hypothetical protein [Aquisphaera insulae]|uniref:hypothetical protein n=1 Tax=Aquisphaera insulae TaxID=2712864 RepID=UPI0013ED86A6|nr:hypothetical protein [Aquisphaera insulae]